MNYLEVQATVGQVISEFGRTVTFKSVGNPTDPNLPWSASSAAGTIASAAAVFVPHTGPGFGLEFIPDDLLKRAKEVCLVAHSTTDLSTTDFITDGVDYRVEWCYTLKPGATVLLYAFGINR